MSAHFDVAYPSGDRFSVTGTFGVVRVDDDHGTIPTVNRGDDIVVLDPRAVVRKSGTRLYGPRDNADLMPWRTTGSRNIPNGT